MYYRGYNSIWKNIGHNLFRCIASYREREIGVISIIENLSPNLYPCDSKETALASLKEDAYWDNAYVYEYTERRRK